MSQQAEAYDNARMACEGMDAMLTSVLTPEENQFIAENKWVDIFIYRSQRLKSTLRKKLVRMMFSLKKL